MDYLRNHCWCSRSHWDGKEFDCEIIVTLRNYEEGYKEDWEALTVEKDFYDEELANERASRMLKTLKEKGQTVTDEELEEYKQLVGSKSIRTLKPEVLEWLSENVSDFSGGKGWCVGDDTYNAEDSFMKYSIFFQRRRDAMAFIKRWSVHKKPIYYTQYFTDVRKVLNLETGRYEKRT